MKSRELIEQGSVCQNSFVDGIDTITELQANRDQATDCRYLYEGCPQRNPSEGPGCIPRFAQDVARNIVGQGTTLDEELKEFAAFFEPYPQPQKGFFDPTEQDIEQAFNDKQEFMRQVRGWTLRILGVAEIDAGSINRSYDMQPSGALLEKHTSLQESLFDEEEGRWLHSCGATLAKAKVYRTVEIQADGRYFGGTGEVRVEECPFCPNCSEEPSEHGPPITQDVYADEAAILRRMRNNNR